MVAAALAAVLALGAAVTAAMVSLQTSDPIHQPHLVVDPNSGQPPPPSPPNPDPTPSPTHSDDDDDEDDDD